MWHRSLNWNRFWKGNPDQLFNPLAWTLNASGQIKEIFAATIVKKFLWTNFAHSCFQKEAWIVIILRTFEVSCQKMWGKKSNFSDLSAKNMENPPLLSTGGQEKNIYQSWKSTSPLRRDFRLVEHCIMVCLWSRSQEEREP